MILGLIVTTLLSACGKGGGLYDDSGQTYRVATSSDMNTLDTVLATDTVLQFIIKFSKDYIH